MASRLIIAWQAARKMRLGPEVRSYRQLIETSRAARQAIKGVSHATVVTGWDNTPRSGRRGLVLSGYNQENFRRAIRDAIALERANKTPLLFVKSWNEWAEGNTVEPRFEVKWSAGAVLKEVLTEELSNGKTNPQALTEVLLDG